MGSLRLVRKGEAKLAPLVGYPSAVTLFRRKRGRHVVIVYDARPLPDDPKPYEPYFVAICECGWLGEPRDSSEEAFRDAYKHDPNVAEEMYGQSADRH